MVYTTPIYGDFGDGLLLFDPHYIHLYPLKAIDNLNCNPQPLQLAKLQQFAHLRQRILLRVLKIIRHRQPRAAGTGGCSILLRS